MTQNQLNNAGGTIQKADKPRQIANYASTVPAEIDLSLAGNPFGSSSKIETDYKRVAEEIGHVHGRYPHVSNHLVEKLKRLHGINDNSQAFETSSKMSPDIYLGGGTTGVIQDIFNSGLMSSGECLVVPESTFPVPAGFAAQNLMNIRPVSLTNDLRINFEQMRNAVESTRKGGYKVSMVFMANPNNPTGYAEPTNSIIKLACDCPEALFVVSEANIEYLSDAALKRIGGSLLDPKNIGKLPKNMVVLRSFSKAYGMADDRVGYAVGDTQILDAVRKKVAPFHMSAHSIINAMIALDDQDHVAKSKVHMEKETKKIATALTKMGFPDVTKSDSNLLVARVPSYFTNSDELAKLLLDKGCAVVSCGPEFGRQLAGTYIRIAPDTVEKNAKFLEITEQVCASKEASYLANQVEKGPALSLSNILSPLKASANTLNTSLARMVNG